MYVKLKRLTGRRVGETSTLPCGPGSELKRLKRVVSAICQQPSPMLVVFQIK